MSDTNQDKKAKKVNRFAKYKNKKKDIEAFVPTEPKKETSEDKKKKELEEFYNSSKYKNMEKLVYRLYDEIENEHRNVKTELMVYENVDEKDMNKTQYYDFIVLRLKILALSEQFTFEALSQYTGYLKKPDLKDIVKNWLLYTKYIMVQKDPMNGLTEFSDIETTIYNYLNLNSKKPVSNELEILMKKPKKKTKKTKQQIKPIEAPTIKPIVFKKEEILNKNDLLKQAEANELRTFDETKEPLILIFIGHVDSGKSTISGNILYLSGKVSDLEMRKLKEEASNKDRESWYVAYIMDTDKDEREKGKTVDVGRACFSTKNKRFTVLDCPGHRNYVQNMISGAAQADVACLIVSAKPGEFEAGFEKDGQTREHAMLAKSLGAKHLVVCINKMDTVDWDEERVNYIKTNLTPFLVSSCDYKEKDIAWCCIEGLTGKNIKEPIVNENAKKWYKGKTLLDTFDSLPKTERSDKQIVRFPILDKQTFQGNLTVFGKVESGLIKRDMELILMPHMKKLTVTKLTDDEENEMAFAGVGESIRLIVKGVEEEQIKRGDVICGLQYWVNICEEFKAEIKVLDLQPLHFFGPGFTVILHMHTILCEATVTKIEKLEESETETKKGKTVKYLQSQQQGVIRIKTKKPICLEKFKDFADLGRFALRKDTHTVAVGKVTAFKPINKELLKGNYYFKAD